ncbi:hypothetical protein [Phocaeicola oris]|uniref:hypothetical protein n=1 Tax=Phocaeicola oris TaxID=2896850 RepID=UPI00234EBAE5|nr:hypothetical protein [Phocaeicola oris]MCE2615485.1 hypothetical protein [Phocaeicola oris]
MNRNNIEMRQFTQKYIFFIVLMVLTLVPDTYLWIKGTEGEDTNLLIHTIWYTPSLIILLCWWMAHKERYYKKCLWIICLGLILFTLPKIVYCFIR